MIRLLIAITAFGLVVSSFGAVAVADEPPSSVEAPEQLPDELDDEALSDDELSDDFGLAHRRRIYESSRLETSRALMYSAALPGLGNFYAEQYAVGTVSMMALAFSAMFIGFGLVNSHSGVTQLGLVSTGVTYVTSGAFAYYGVRRYNANLRRSLHIDDPESALFSSRHDAMIIQMQWSY